MSLFSWCGTIMLFKYLCYLGMIYVAGGAKILTLMLLPMYSHYQIYHSLYKELSVRGHEVTLISPFKENNTKNFTSILVEYDTNIINELKKELTNSYDSNVIVKNMAMENMVTNVTELFLSSNKIKHLLKSNKTFDLIVMSDVHGPAIKGLCYHFGVPCVSMNTFISNRWANTFMSNPGSPSFVPELLSGLAGPLNFYQRLYNSLLYFIFDMYSHIYVYPEQEIIRRKYFPDAPSVYELMYNSSLMLINTHYSISGAVPYNPNMIEVGGLHVKPPKPLPEEIKLFLDDAKHGAVYFSLGSNIKSQFLPLHVKTDIMETFSKLKQRVLCKWDDELPFASDNVKVQKWLPQNDVLAHPNVKLFITHGGQMSSIEAVHHGVPILGMPVFGDQYMNVANGVLSGYALLISLKDFTREKFQNALDELLNTTKYYDNIQKRSRIFHDQPMKPMDRAIFWIEHVIRHGNARHLRTAASNLTWYQYYLLDVVAVLLLILLFVYLCLRSIVKIILSYNSNGTNSKKNN